MLPRIEPSLQPAAAHALGSHDCRYRCGCPSTGRRPYIEAQSDSTSREDADGCNAARSAGHDHSRVGSHAITGARPVSDTRAHSYVDAPSVPNTNGSAESHGYANPYSDADSAAHTGGYSGSDCTTNSNADTGPNAYTDSYPA